MEAVIPRPDVAPMLQAGFVALASDCDEPEDEVIALAQQVEDAMMLPFILFADAEGNYIDGYSGVVTPPYLIKKLNEHSGS
ncbi:MAG: hypothetical protein P8M11_07095 [Planctomycetota bacterium]|nr:hypothetical protein [Planctomycetota bacterium]